MFKSFKYYSPQGSVQTTMTEKKYHLLISSGVLECHCAPSHCNLILFSGGPLVLVFCWAVLAVSFSSCLPASGAGSGSFLIWSTVEIKYAQLNPKHLSEGTTLNCSRIHPGPHSFLFHFHRNRTMIQLIPLGKGKQFLSLSYLPACPHYMKGHWTRTQKLHAPLLFSHPTYESWFPATRMFVRIHGLLLFLFICFSF